MDKNEAIKAAQKYKESISGTVNFDEVFLYDFFAKGNQKEYSDIDIALIVEDCGDKYFEIVKKLWKLR